MIDPMNDQVFWIVMGLFPYISMDSSSPGLREALTLRWFTPLGATLLDRINRLLSFLKGTVTGVFNPRVFREASRDTEQKIFVELRKRFSGRCCKPICDKDFLCVENCIQPRSKCTKADCSQRSSKRRWRIMLKKGGCGLLGGPRLVICTYAWWGP